MPNTIIDFFEAQHVLVTGGTGFMGKVLIEKLLRDIPNIEKIYLLIRPKKGQDPVRRFEEIYNSPYGPFSVLREKYPDRWRKVEVIAADVSMPNLALSESDKSRILENVSILFHVAANVRFDQSLKTAIKANTGGTLNVLNLAKQMPRLKSFLHVSTAYSQSNEEILEERHYPTSISPEDMLSIIDQVDDIVLEALTLKLLGNHPNTYSFSKALSEDLVARCGLPAGVARPSIVVACWKEPLPGWIESLNGATSIIVGGGKGVMRSMLASYDYPSHVIPCDNAINATIALAWKVSLEKPKEPIFMNITGTVNNPLSWKYIVDTGRDQLEKTPFTNPLWYPGGEMRTSKLSHALRIIAFQLIPACLLDILLYVTGKKPFLLRLQAKIIVGLQMLQYYTIKKWKFQSVRMENLEQQLSPSDRKLFFMSTKNICWDDFFHHYVIGVRYYCLKEDPSSVPEALRAFKYYWAADILLKTILGLYIAWLLFSWIKPLTIARQILSQ